MPWPVEAVMVDRQTSDEILATLIASPIASAARQGRKALAAITRFYADAAGCAFRDLLQCKPALLSFDLSDISRTSQELSNRFEKRHKSVANNSTR
jgi:hypothetical protein